MKDGGLDGTAENEGATMFYSGRRVEKRTRVLTGAVAIFYACVVILSAFVAISV